MFVSSTPVVIPSILPFSRYSSFKSLPDALGVEQEEWPQQLPQNAKPHYHPQDADSQGHSNAVRSQDGTQKGRSPVHSTSVTPQKAKHDTRQVEPITSVKSQNHEDRLQTVHPHDHHVRLKQHSQLGSHQRHPPTERSLNSRHDTASGTIAGHTPSPTVLRRASSVLSGQRVSPDEGKPSAVRR